MNYPIDAYCPETGQLWWEMEYYPNSKRPHGDERRLAAWLAYNVQVGDLLTTRQLRSVVRVDEGDNEKEHFQRRFRELRKDGWVIRATKDDRRIPVGSYRIDAIGWHPGLDECRPSKGAAISAATRRRVLERDGSRCRICGVGAGEPYPGEPHRIARMTVGHVNPGIHGGSGDISNLRSECSDCNETARSATPTVESLHSVHDGVRNLNKSDLARFTGWVRQGYRSRDRVDELFDRYRAMAPGDQDRLRADPVLGG